jgi:hypothetical protein
LDASFTLTLVFECAFHLMVSLVKCIFLIKLFKKCLNYE